MKPFIDIAVNLTHPDLQADFADWMLRALQMNVNQQVGLASTLEDIPNLLHLCETWPPYLMATAGVHPHYADTWTSASSAMLEAFWPNPHLIAVGECGLDFHRNLSHPNQQINAFKAQLSIAEKLNLPVVLHERDAFEPMMKILNQHQVKGVLHCFTGDQEALEAYLSYGLYIGITGWVCDKKRGRNLQTLIQSIPDERLLLETDSPYLRPKDLPKTARVGISGRNEPSYLPHIAMSVAKLKQQDLSRIRENTWHNFQTLFSME
jgi:TatD DNase family protein